MHASYHLLLLLLQGVVHLTRAQNFQKTNISYPLMRTHMCAHQGVRNVSFRKMLRTY